MYGGKKAEKREKGRNNRKRKKENVQQREKKGLERFEKEREWIEDGKGAR